MKTVSETKKEELEKKKEDWYYTPLDKRFHRRGRVVLLYQTHDRPGADIDVLRFELVFKALGFETFRWKDYSAQKVKEAIKEEKAAHPHQRGSELFCFIIMSHGDAGHITCFDGETLNINSDIKDKFDGDNWPAMKNTPKLIIIQCCHGKRMSGLHKGLQEDGLAQTEGWATNQDVHPKQHFLVINSTYDDYVAVRDPSYGAWFLEELVLLMELYVHEHPINKIALMANDMLSKRMSYNEGAVQTAKIESTLRKELYILPKHTAA